MQLKVGEFYLNASREIIRIYGKKDNFYFSSPLDCYKENGKSIPETDYSEFDLIKHISKELHQSIINQILTPD